MSICPCCGKGWGDDYGLCFECEELREDYCEYVDYVEDIGQGDNVGDYIDLGNCRVLLGETDWRLK